MNYEESNFNQEVTLPSKGLLNPEIPGGVVTQRCMMVADQKFLLGSNQSSRNQINQILQRTTIAPEGFDINNLSLPDTLYLLFKLRVLSYGNEYTFRTRCPECGNKIEVTVDLADLAVETLEEGYAESMTVELPHRKDTVITKILTNADIEELNNELKRRKRKNPNDESDYVLRIVKSIEKIILKKEKKELTHPIDIERYVNSLTGLDASMIINARDSVSFGITPVVEKICPECKEYIDVSMNFSGDFFRPNFSRK